MADEIAKAKKALIKKALGFKTKEVIEEYSTTDGQIVLTKKKVTEKLIPPDCTAIKMLIEGEDEKVFLTDQELEQEKERLLKLLKEKQNDTKKNK